MSHRSENDEMQARIDQLGKIPEYIREMSLDELRAEQERLAAGYRKGTPARRPADLHQAVAHGLRAGFGMPVQNAHPLVADIRNSDGSIDLIAAAALAIEARTGRRPEVAGDGYNILASSLSTGDFPDLLREATTALVRSRPSDDLALLQAITRRIDVPNYRPATSVFAGFEALPQPAAHTSQHFNVLKPRFTSEQAQVHTSTDMLLLSRQALTDDAFGVIEALASAYVATAVGTQVQALVDLLESNGDLSDGSALFLDNVNSTTVGGTLTETGLTAVTKMMREQSRILRAQADPGGNVLDARVAALLVPSDFEVYAQQLVETLPQAFRPAVYATARLSGDHLYAFAAPDQHPAIGRTLMQGSPATGVSLGALRSADVWDAAEQRDVNYPGLGLEVSHSVGLAPLGRAGIVRGAFSA